LTPIPGLGTLGQPYSGFCRTIQWTSL
jgi:hypothetical protein